VVFRKRSDQAFDAVATQLPHLFDRMGGYPSNLSPSADKGDCLRCHFRLSVLVSVISNAKLSSERSIDNSECLA